MGTLLLCPLCTKEINLEQKDVMSLHWWVCARSQRDAEILLTLDLTSVPIKSPTPQKTLHSSTKLIPP